MERTLKNFIITRVAGAVIASLALIGLEVGTDNSRLPREIASYSDGKYTYKMSAACGLYDTRAVHNPEIGQQILRLQGKNETVIAYTDNLLVNGGLYYERYNFSGIAERLGYHRYKGTFGDIQITGGIFCPPRF
jgi:hypothetical protein